MVQPKENEVTKLEVKVDGKPRPDVKWFKQGEELFPSEEYTMENFDDGTSILIINNVYEDDTGEITFEAHNPLGVAVTTTELSVEGIFLEKFGWLVKVFFLFYVEFLSFQVHSQWRQGQFYKEKLFKILFFRLSYNLS